MIHEDLQKAVKDLGWNFAPGKLELVYEQVKSLYLNYEQILQVGRVINTKPGVSKLVREIKNLVESSGSKDMYELIRLDGEHYETGLQKTIEYSFINPILIFCTDMESVYKAYLEELMLIMDEKPDIYEIAWMWLFNKEYRHELPIPDPVLFPLLWKFYGVEV